MRTPLSIMFAVLLAAPCARAADPVFVEKGGVVVIEAESTASRLGRWKLKAEVDDYTGEGHLEFTGNKPESGPADSPLKYSFRINKPGKYQLTLRAHKRLVSKREDICNDCYVAVEGDYEAGGGADRKVLGSDTKMFGGDSKGWGWTNQLDVHHKKFPAIYEFKEDEVYELTISGRSQNFNFDRILFVHDSANMGELRRKNPDESKADDGAGAGLPERVKRTLRNKEGRAVKAELIEKQGDTLIALVKGRKFPIPIASLSKEDQEFVAEWAGEE